jgi:quercetin dioxygenase-like cupin family protein
MTRFQVPPLTVPGIVENKNLSLKVHMLRKMYLIGGLAIALAGTAIVLVRAAERVPIDSAPPESILVNLDEFYAQHPVTNDAPRSDRVITTPRCAVSIVSNKGTLVGRHMHTNVDEIVFVYKGTGEILVNGKWTPVKAGDLHVCPRGVPHATRVAGTNIMEVISIFTPPPPGGNDRLMLDN